MVALVGAAVVVVTFSYVGLDNLAVAAAPSCASPPANYTGTDATVAAITQLDQDVDANCSAIAGRLDGLDSDLTALKSEAHSDSGTLATADSAILTQLDSWTSGNPLQVALPAGGSGQAVQVTNWPGSQTVEFGTSASSQLDGDAQANHTDLWFLIGAIVGCFLLGEFLRKAWP